MTPEALMSLATARGVNLDAVSRGTPPEWTAEDVALAAAGLPRIPFAVALYILAGDDRPWGTLRTYLLEYLLAERERHQWTKWAEHISGDRVKFAEPLIALVLAEARAPGPTQAAPELRAQLLGVEPVEWRRAISHQWAAVMGELHRNLLDAEEHIRHRLRHIG